MKAALLKLTEPGHEKTFIEIATELFGTPPARNAGIGMARRLRLPPPPPKPIKLPTIGIDAPIVPEPPPRINGSLTIYQLRRDDCRWPSGINPPYSYCGHPAVDGLPYCQPHCDRAYNRPHKVWS